MVHDLDDVDRGILHLLQENAREATAAAMGDQVGVASSTVRNRINHLEENDVIRGYHPEINYERCGFQLHVLIECRARPKQRVTLAEEVRAFPGVIRVREMMTGSQNLHIEAVGTDSDAIDDLTESLDDLGLEIVHSNVIKTDYVQPFNHFGQDIVDD